MKPTLPLITAAIMLAAPVFAQERTAGQAYDAQVNWAALKNSIDLVSTQNKALTAIIGKMQTCSAKDMLFVGTEQAGADSDGCKSPGVNGKIVTDASKQTTVTSPQGSGWVTKECPDGYVMTGGFWSHSDTWAMHCRPLILK